MKWERVPLSALCANPDDIRCGPFGTQLNKDEFREAGIPLWGIKQVNVGFSIQTKEFLDPQTAKRLKQYELLPGDLVMTRKGTVGNCAVYPSDFEPGIMHSDLLRMRVDPKRCDSSFLVYQLHHSQDVARQLSLISGGAIMPGINVGRLKQLEVIVPPLTEQKRIAAILDAADALRAKRREALAQLDALLQSNFLTLFGDPVTNPMGWDRNKLEAVCERVVDCPHSTPKWTESGVVCLRTSNLGKGEWNWTDTRYVTEEDYADRTKRSEVIPGDLVLSREGTVGVLALVVEGMRVCMGQRLVQLRAKTSILSPAFMLYLLLHDLAPERLGRLMAGSTSKHLNVKDLRKLSIPLPPLPLQQKFAAIVESIERQKTTQRAHLAELDALFAALQHRAFRGEL